MPHAVIVVVLFLFRGTDDGDSVFSSVDKSPNLREFSNMRKIFDGPVGGQLTKKRTNGIEDSHNETRRDYNLPTTPRYTT